MTAYLAYVPIWSAEAMIRPWLEVSVEIRLPRTSSSTEFLRLATCGSCSSSGRSEATAIIIPKTVETTASTQTGSRIASSRSFFRRGLTRGGSGGGSGTAARYGPVGSLMRVGAPAEWGAEQTAQGGGTSPANGLGL